MATPEPPAYGMNAAAAAVAVDSATPGRGRSGTDHLARGTTREQVQQLKDGLFAALQDLRTQNDDLTQRIGVLGKASSESAKQRAAAEAALRSTLETASSLRSKRRSLPKAPGHDRGQPVERAGSDDGSPGTDCCGRTCRSSELIERLRDRCMALTRERDEARSLLVDNESTATRLSGADAQEAAVRDDIKRLLQARGDELEAQLRQADEENAALHRAIAERDAMLEASTAASTMAPGSRDALLAQLEEALDQRDEALALAATADQQSQELKHAESQLATTRMGFENATKMMVSYCTALEARLADGQEALTAAVERVSELERERHDQDRLVSGLLAELERERTRVSGTSSEDAVGRAMEVLRAKQAESEAHAAAAERYRCALDKEGHGAACTGTPTSAAANGAPRHELVDLRLPVGWESAVSPEGLTYFVDHASKTTSWAHPGFRHPKASSDGSGVLAQESDGTASDSRKPSSPMATATSVKKKKWSGGWRRRASSSQLTSE